MNGGELESVVAAVMSSTGYAQLDPGMVSNVAARELQKRSGVKQVIKATRTKLHQVAGAYLEDSPTYTAWMDELATLPCDPANPALRDFCRRVMRHHASTRERLDILDEFYERTLEPLRPIHSLLDLACGLNPLTLPWIPLAPGAEAWVCDVVKDMLNFDGQFIGHMGYGGGASICDLTQTIPERRVQVALLLKTIPCLEQLDKNIGPRLLEGIRAEHMLISFPRRSLGGYNKGMPRTYAAHFGEMVQGKQWRIERFDFPSELVYLVSK